MASLQEICARLSVVAKDGLEQAQALGRCAVAIEGLAARTRRLMDVERGPDVRVLADLHAAARACRVAAAALENVARTSRAWAADVQGPAGAARYARGVAGADGAPDTGGRMWERWPEAYIPSSQDEERRLVAAYADALGQFLSGPRTPASRMAFLRAWIGEVNPRYALGRTAYTHNCGMCARAVQAVLRGEPECAGGFLGGFDFETSRFMQMVTGRQQESMPPDGVVRRLKALGAGASAIVGIDRDGGEEGHWFNAYFDGETVWYVDAQISRVSGWPPPDLGAVAWDASFYEPSPWEIQDGPYEST